MTRLETWLIKLDIDSSDTGVADEVSLGDFTSSDWVIGVAASFEDPPTATLKATDGSKRFFTNDTTFERISSNENH